jgi:hypothetical protein
MTGAMRLPTQQAAPAVQVLGLLRSRLHVLKGLADVGDQPILHVGPAVQPREVQSGMVARLAALPTAASNTGRLVIASSLPCGCTARQYQLHRVRTPPACQALDP